MASAAGEIIFLENDSFIENLTLSLESHLHLSSGLSPIGRWDNLCLLFLGCLLPFPTEYSIVALLSSSCAHACVRMSERKKWEGGGGIRERTCDAS